MLDRLAEGTSNPGILLHGVAFYRTPIKPQGDDIDASLIWITPPGGGEVRLAEDFAFRAEAPPPAELGQVVLKSGRFDDEFRVLHHTVQAEGAPPAPGTPTQPPPSPPQTPGPGETPPEEGGCATTPGALLTVLGPWPWLTRARRRRPTGCRSSSPGAPTDRTARR